MLSAADAAQPRHPVIAEMFDAFPIPLVVLDNAGRVVDVNPAAEVLWSLQPAEARGIFALDILGITRIRGEDVSPWPSWPAFRQDLLDGERVPCRIIGRDGTPHLAALVSAPLTFRGSDYVFLGVLQEAFADQLPSVPAWAFTDPVTGLYNRVYWSHHQGEYDDRPGRIVLADVDDLKSINDRYGHAVGDRVLAAVGTALQALLPPGAVAIRYGGDEFLVWTAPADTEWEDSLSDQLTAESLSANLPVAPHLSVGSAVYAPGTLAEALEAADDAMYQQKGTVLRSQHRGRIIVNRLNRLDVASAASVDAPDEIGEMARHFGPEFDAAYRASYSQATEEARQFVTFLGPVAGAAVLEVGAGTGRLAFDGGLADAVGPEGVLLLTDPSAVQLEQARQRAIRQRCTWMHFLTAPAEYLPVASGGPDLVVGAWFLHLCSTSAVLRELARVVRPGGRIALDVTLSFPLPPAWEDMLSPLREALTRHHLLFRTPGHDPGEVAIACRDLGLAVERQSVRPGGRFQFPTASAAWNALDQGGHLRVMSRGLPLPVRTSVLAAVKERMVTVFASTTDQERTAPLDIEYVVARRA